MIIIILFILQVDQRILNFSTVPFLLLLLPMKPQQYIVHPVIVTSQQTRMEGLDSDPRLRI